MPIYEYYCPKCDDQFELIHSVSTKKTKCPECGGKIKRLISQNAFHLKGGGWYKDGYDATRKKTKDAPSGAKDSSSSASGGDTKKKAKKTAS